MSNTDNPTTGGVLSPQPAGDRPLDRTASGQGAVSPDAARQELAALKGDRTFLNDFAAGKVEARQRVARLDAIIVGGADTLPNASDARARLSTIQHDPVLAKKFADGDVELRREVAALNETIGKEAETAPSPDAASAEAPDPKAYKMPQLDPDGALSTTGLMKADTFFRGALATARFDVDMARGLTSEAERFGTVWGKLDEPARKVMADSEAKSLQRTWGAEYGRKVGLARDLVTSLDERYPGLARFVDRSGLGNSAFFIGMCCTQAERLLAMPD